MLKLIPSEFVLTAGLLVPMCLGFAQTTASKPDPRLPILENFFAARHCPIRDLAPDFLIAADRNGIDWRLLPSISFVESGGGKVHRNNNIFGWNSGHHRFSSVRESIHATAAKLAHSKLYRDKDLDHILLTYNPRRQWGDRIKSVMRSIGSAGLSETAVVAALE